MRLKITPLLACLIVSSAAIAADAPASKPATRADAVLNKKMPEIKFEATLLGDVVDALHEASGATISLDTDALRKVRIDVMSTVTVRVEVGHTLGEVLDEILLKLDSEKRLAYTVEDGAIMLTTKTAAQAA